MSEKINFQPWYATGDDFIRGLDAPEDADIDDVIAAFLWDIEGIELADLTISERDSVAECVMFLPMRSVVKADRDELCDDCDWHTDGSGARRRECWWLESRVSHILGDVMERIQRECNHEEINRSGMWCDGCGLNIEEVKAMS